jgi:GTP pyrophosphokinase
VIKPEKLTSRFTQAFEFAAKLHKNQYRKSTQIPYIAHLMSVASLVLEAGGDEDQAISALLHDSVEDQGGYPTLKEIREQFGERVAFIVKGCSDAFTQPKPPWRERKESYLEHLLVASPEVRLVSLADKLHNARSILRDLLQNGETAFNKFNGGKTGTLWYYRQLVNIFQQTDDNIMVGELSDVVKQIEKITQMTLFTETEE